VSLIGWLTPAAAAANFFWPPALYYYSFTKWRVVVAGLAIEAAAYVVGLRLAVRKAIVVAVVTKIVSAGLGFVVTWPVVFYWRGVEFLFQAFGEAPFQWIVAAIVAFIVALNITVEYWVAVLWCGIPPARNSKGPLASHESPRPPTLNPCPPGTAASRKIPRSNG